MDLISKIEGRYPHKPCRLNPKAMSVEAQVYKDDVVIRIDDNDNLDFWLQISISRDQLENILKQMSEKEE